MSTLKLTTGQGEQRVDVPAGSTMKYAVSRCLEAVGEDGRTPARLYCLTAGKEGMVPEEDLAVDYEGDLVMLVAEGPTDAS